MFRFILVKSYIIFLCFAAVARDVPVNPALFAKPWSASWITCPQVPQRDYGIFHFRKAFALPAKPGRFIVHISADNRYRLFVNGEPVCFGPARGDLYNWYFESIDIAPYLHAGTNIIAALVWNMGTLAPVAQISNQTAFLLQGDTGAESIINSDHTWKVMQNLAYKPCSINNGERLKTYMVIGPGDEVDAATYPWGWEQAAYDDADWRSAEKVAEPVTAGHGTDNLWTLRQRNIPLMEETLQRLSGIARSAGVEANAAFLQGSSGQVIPANTKASILLDQGFNTVAFPQLKVSGGKGASIMVTYAEALVKEGIKGNRDSIARKHIIGNYDVFKPDGSDGRWFRPLWLRTYRYVQLDIETGGMPLTINDFYGMYTGYPFKQKAVFRSNDSSLQRIWDVGWRTARLCAGETYYDCPYYEQLQYEGDTRIQSLISLYVTGDDRLMRKALTDFFNSRVPEGLTQGRYPSNRLQVIPPFSLYWVSMVFDYWQHRQDDAFVRSFLHAVQGVLEWYEKHIDSKTNMLGPMPWWNFTDWDTAFDFGVPEGANDGNSSVITLQYANTLREAAKLFACFNRPAAAMHYNQLAGKLCASTYKLCFDQQTMRMANTPEKRSFSQHAGIMGILCAAVPPAQMKAVMQKILSGTGMSQATFYYRFYLTRALKVAGMADMYYEQLAPWRGMLANGLTTFAENPDPTRSDCHAWSASPNYDFFATICGIVPDAPGFKKVLIAPHPGALREIDASMPHPAGTIDVKLKRIGKDGIRADVTLPAGVTGRFIWQGRAVALPAGKKTVML